MSVKSEKAYNRCVCCPYGFHIDADFINYCETLVETIKTASAIRNSGGSFVSSNYGSQSGRETRSLPRRPGRLTSSYSLNNNDALSALTCDCNSSRTGASSSCSMTSEPASSVLLASRSISLPCDDGSLNEVVEKFEEVLREQRRKAVRAGRAQRRMQDALLSAPTTLYEDASLHLIDSPPASPSSGVSLSTSTTLQGVSREDEVANYSRMRLKEVEEQLRVLPLLKQQTITKAANEQRVVRKSASYCGPNNSYDLHALPRDIEHTPIVSDEQEDDYREGKHVQETSLKKGRRSSVNRNDVADVCVGTDATSILKADTADAAVLTSPSSAKAFCTSVLRESISIAAEEDKKEDKKVPTTRSVYYIRTNFASLTRNKAGSLTRSVSSMPRYSGEFEADENRKSFVSQGTDPIDSKNEITSSNDFSCQVFCEGSIVSTQTEVLSFKDVATSYQAEDVEAKSETKCSQTTDVSCRDASTQMSGQCIKCELKQTETIGVGTCTVSTSDISVMTTSFEESVESNESCISNEINHEYGDFPETVSPSPTNASKIPRRASLPPISPKRTRSDIIIEESNNELLVYCNPDALDDGIPSSGKHRALLPQMIHSKIEGQMEEACKIEDTDTESDENGSDSSEEGTYEVATAKKVVSRKKVAMRDPSKEMKAALKVLNDSLQKSDRANNPATTKSIQIVESEWFQVAASKGSDSSVVEGYLDTFEGYSKQLLNYVVNMADKNGNTAIHYAISHSNFDAASVLLDSKVCDVNKQNKAGYSAVMLVSLAKVNDDTQKAVIRRLFQLGDVNSRAKQNGQTALMLAASHGQFVTCKLLIEAGAALNVQDNDGSTALMCSSEHGHVDVVRLLLSYPDCDLNACDNDGSTALSIAMESGNKNIGLILYASSTMLSRGSAPYASLRRSQPKAVASSLRRTGSFTTRKNRNGLQLSTSPPLRSRNASSSSTPAIKSPPKT